MRIKLKRPNHRYPSCQLVGRYLKFPVTTTRYISWVEFVFPSWDLAGYNINQRVRQGCNLSPALFNIYVEDFLRNWKHKADTGIKLKRNLYLETLFFSDDQVIIQDSEDKLQKSVYLLNQMSKDYNLKIFTHKTKIMAFKGKQLVRSKICGTISKH